MIRRNKVAARKVIQVLPKVKEVAEKRGRSRTWIARKAELQYNTIQRLWVGEPIADVSLVTLIKIAMVLDVPVDQLYEVLPEE
jgi:hypothetical protein